MKKLSSLIAALFFLVLSFNANAQTSPAREYFAGKWDVLIEGLPQGDPKMIIDLNRKDGKLEGAILDSTKKEAAKITKVDESEKSITVYFTKNDNDVTMDLNKKDEDNVTVSLLGMFEGKGVRMKETK